MRTRVPTGGKMPDVCNQVRISMTALAAKFFTLDDVNRLKIIQDVIDRRRPGISDRQYRLLLARYREDATRTTLQTTGTVQRQSQCIQDQQ